MIKDSGENLKMSKKRGKIHSSENGREKLDVKKKMAEKSSGQEKI